jgi:hypothetical protein
VFEFTPSFFFDFRYDDHVEPTPQMRRSKSVRFVDGEKEASLKGKNPEDPPAFVPRVESPSKKIHSDVSGSPRSHRCVLIVVSSFVQVGLKLVAESGLT